MKHTRDHRPGDARGDQREVRSSILRRHAEQLLLTVEPVVAVARTFTGFFLGLSLLSMLGAMVLLLALFLPIESAAGWKLILMAVMTLVLISPGVILLLFRVGLEQLIAIPDQLAESLGNVEEIGAEAVAAQRDRTEGRVRGGRFVGLMRSLVDVRAAILQSRDVFAKGVILVRVANPVSLVVVLGATIASILIVGVAAIVALTILL